MARWLTYLLLGLLLILNGQSVAQVIEGPANSVIMSSPLVNRVPYQLGYDSLKEYSFCGGCWRNTKFILPFDSRFSSFTDPLNDPTTTTNVKMFGVKIGLEFYDRYRFGLGFYSQTKNSPTVVNILSEDRTDTAAAKFTFSYSTFFGEYVIYEDFRWELASTIQLGTGNILIDFRPEYDTSLVAKLPVGSIGISAHYKIIPWFGIGAGFGYRKMLLNNNEKNKDVNQAYSKPYFALKVKLFIGSLYKCVFKPDVIKAQREEYNRMRREKRELKDQGKEQKRTTDSEDE